MSPTERSPEVAVYVTASLVGRNSLFIENLSRQDIEILEDGKPRDVQFLAKDEIPVAFGIIFERGMVQDLDRVDASRRSGIQIGSATDIAYDLIDKHLGKQETWVGVYDEHLEVLSDFSTDGFRSKEAIQKIRAMRRPQTIFLYGALVQAVQKFSDRPEKRRILILFSESVDSGTASRSKALHNLFASSNIEIFAVSFARQLGNNPYGLNAAMSQALLKDLASVTSGESFSASEYREHLSDISRRMLNQIRTLYTFGYLSSAEAGNTTKLTVRCTKAGAKVRHHPTVMVGL